MTKFWDWWASQTAIKAVIKTCIPWLYRCLAAAHQSSGILLEKQPHVMVMSHHFVSM
ncbi:hypothetical protein [Solibacillus sp. FSL K6-4121]|uniref:hypothetical protein n=1 Tax=Solibacillus sp. FSL K6-4121 TaxID=2921505 RepID=UPI0030FC2757